MDKFFSVFMPRSLERMPDGSYKVLNGAGAVIDPSEHGKSEASVVYSTVSIDAVLEKLGAEGGAPETVWLYDGDVPMPGSLEWQRYAAKLQTLLECEVLDTRSTIRDVVVPGYGKFLTRK